jgi:hypothetical protein
LSQTEEKQSWQSNEFLSSGKKPPGMSRLSGTKRLRKCGNLRKRSKNACYWRHNNVKKRLKRQPVWKLLGLRRKIN